MNRQLADGSVAGTGARVVVHVVDGGCSSGQHSALHIVLLQVERSVVQGTLRLHPPSLHLRCGAAQRLRQRGRQHTVNHSHNSYLRFVP